MAEADPPVYLCPDTNIFLHFRMFTDIDWPSLVGGRRVVLVLSRTVVKELDTHKNEHRSVKLRERAGKALVKIEAIEETPGREVRPRVTLLAMASYPKRSNAPEGLDLDKPDDRHLAAALEVKTEFSTDVRIVSADIGMRLTAGKLGLGVIKLDESLRNPIEPDELEAELRKVKLENEKLRAVKQPKISVRFADGEHVARFHLRPTGTMSDAEIARRSQEYVARLPIDNLLMLGPPEHVVKSVRTQYEKRRAYKAQAELTATLKLTLFNDGEAPAKGVHLSLSFPENLIVEDDLPEEPQDPEKGMQMGAFFGFDTAIEAIPFERPDDWTITGTNAETSRATVTHTRHIELPELHVRPRSPNDRAPFVIQGKLVIADPPSIETFGLRVYLDGRGERA